MSANEKDAFYEVTLATENLNTYRIRAAYVSIDERLFPGWTLLKDEQGTIKALIRSEMTFLIRRTDEHQQPSAVRPAPSPAAVAAVVGKL